MDVIRQEDKTPELLMEVLGVDRLTAEFILSIENGEINGDLVGVEDND
jgi:hypothetical protein